MTAKLWNVCDAACSGFISCDGWVPILGQLLVCIVTFGSTNMDGPISSYPRFYVLFVGGSIQLTTTNYRQLAPNMSISSEGKIVGRFSIIDPARCSGDGKEAPGTATASGRAKEEGAGDPWLMQTTCILQASSASNLQLRRCWAYRDTRVGTGAQHARHQTHLSPRVHRTAPTSRRRRCKSSATRAKKCEWPRTPAESCVRSKAPPALLKKATGVDGEWTG